MFFYPHGNEDDLTLNNPDYGGWIDPRYRELDDGPSVADYARRDYRLTAKCRFGHVTPIELAQSVLMTPARWLHRMACKCGAEPLEVAELMPPEDFDGQALDVPADDSVYYADEIYEDD